MEPNTIVDLPHVDEDGYFDGLCSCMVDSKGNIMLGADTFNISVPEDDGQHFFKLSADKKSWVAEKIPSTAEECIGIVLDHHKQTARVHKLRQLFEELTKNSSEFRIVQDPETNARSIERIPEKTLEEVREEKLSELSSAFSTWRNTDATMHSSLGFDSDCDERAGVDVQRLIRKMEKSSTLSKSTAYWRGADDLMHPVTLDDLNVLDDEITEAGEAAYNVKWDFEAKIKAATTKEELDAIVIQFLPENFGA